MTCSADGSIRLWNLGSGQEKSSVGLNAASPPTARPANIYSKDVLGVLYMGEPSLNPDLVFVSVEKCGNFA